MTEVKKKRRKSVSWNIELIKEECEKVGFILVSKEYISAKTRLDVICSCGRPHSALIQNIRDGMTCRICGRERASKKTMLSYEYVKEVFESNGCKLISKEYKGNNSKLKYECECGNESEISLAHFQNGRRCKKCAGTEKLAFKDIIERFEGRGIELLTTESEFEKAGQLFKFLCRCGREGSTTLYTVRDNHYCQECHFEEMSKDRRHSVADIRKRFKEEGCILLEEEYVNNSLPLLYECSCGNTAKISYASFLRGSRCRSCQWGRFSESMKFTIDYVRDFFEDKGCTLISDEYISSTYPMLYMCSCGEEAIKSLSVFRDNQTCGNCRTKRTPYKNIDENARVATRMIEGYSEWRIDVLERDSFKCNCCETSENLHVHHMDGYGWCVDRRTDVSNGQILCDAHHRIFHSIYGIKNNTESQYYDFIEIYEQGLLLEALCGELKVS